MDILNNKIMNHSSNHNNKLNKAEIMQSLWAIVGQSSVGEFISCAKDVIRSVDNKTAVKSSPVVSPRSEETSVFSSPKHEHSNNVSFPRNDSESRKLTATQERKEWQNRIEEKYCTKLIDSIKNLQDHGDTLEMEFDQADFGNNDFGPKGKVYQKDTTKAMYRWDNDIKYSLVWFFNSFKKSKDMQRKMSFKVEVPSVCEESERKTVKVIFSNDPDKFDKKVASASMPIIERNVSTPEVQKTSGVNVDGVTKNLVESKDDGPTFS